MSSGDMELLVFSELSVNLKEAVITIKASDVIEQVFLFYEKESRLLKLAYWTEQSGLREVALARVQGTPRLQQGGVDSARGLVSVRVSLESCSLCALTPSARRTRGVGELCVSRGGERLHVSCAFCGEALTHHEGSRVRRVRPLPSEGWECMAEEWFCHPIHDEAGQPKSPMEKVEKLSLKPGIGDLFYTEMFYVVSGGSVPRGSRRRLELGNKREGLSVTCGACEQLLGSEHEHWVELYQSQVALRLSPLVGSAVPTQEVTCSVERMVGQLCRKLRLEGHVSKVLVKPYEADSVPVSLPSGLKEPWPTPRVLGFLWLLHPEWGVSVFSSRSGRTQYESGRVVQLMYLTRVEGGARVGAFRWELWLSDPGAYRLELPYPLCLQLFRQLLASSSLLPPHHRDVGACMRLGFLRTD